MHVSEAKGNPELQRKQVAQLESELAFDSEDLIGLLPTNSSDIHNFQYSIFEPRNPETGIRDRSSKREKIVCAVFHQVLPSSMFDTPETKKRRLFSVTANQTEMGRIQADQIVHLLSLYRRASRSILYVTGPTRSYATKLRLAGANEVFSRNDVTVHLLQSQWDGTDLPDALQKWLASGGQLEWLHAAAAQNDQMAELLKDLMIKRGQPEIPVVGMDGTDVKGKKLVANRKLMATVIQPLGVAEALRVYEDLVLERLNPVDLPANRDFQLTPKSYPAMEELQPIEPRES